MLTILGRWLGGKRSAERSRGLASSGHLASDRPNIPRYPPYDDGFPAVGTEDLLSSQARLIESIDHEMGMRKEEFDRYVYPILSNYAAFVHLLPASKAHHHRGAGGLFRHGLEVANHSLRALHGRIIDGQESGQRRKELEIRWRIAVLAAALGHDLGKPAIDMTIFDRNGKKQWDVFSTTIVEWMHAQNVENYYIRWTPNRVNGMHENLSLSLLPRVVPAEVFDFLKRGDPRVISTLYSVLSGTVNSSAGRVIADLVHKADQASVAADLKGQRIAEEDPSLGVPAARFLVDAMKRLVNDGHWKPNQLNQPLWVSPDAAFIDWDRAVPQINKLLDADNAPGVPRTADAMAQALVDYDVIEESLQDDDYPGLYVRVAPEPMASTKAVHSISCVRLRRMDLFFDGPDPAPVKCYVGSKEIEARKAQNTMRAEKQNEEANRRAKARQSNRPLPFKVIEGDVGSDVDASSNHPETQVTPAELSKEPVESNDPPPETPIRNGADNEPTPDVEGQRALRWYQSLPKLKQTLIREHIIRSDMLFRSDGSLCLPHPDFFRSVPGDLIPNGVTDISDWLATKPGDKWALVQRNLNGHARAIMFKPEVSEVLERIIERPNLTGLTETAAAESSEVESETRNAVQTKKRRDTTVKQEKPKRTPLAINDGFTELAPKLQVLFRDVASAADQLECVVKDSEGTWISHDDLVTFTSERHDDIPERYLRLQLSSSPLLKSRTRDGVRQVNIWEDV